MDDVIKAANLSTKLQERRKQAVDHNMTPDEQEDEGEYDPNMDPDAKIPGHHFVMGKGWIKNN